MRIPIGARRIGVCSTVRPSEGQMSSVPSTPRLVPHLLCHRNPSPIPPPLLHLLVARGQAVPAMERRVEGPRILPHLHERQKCVHRRRLPFQRESAGNEATRGAYLGCEQVTQGFASRAVCFRVTCAWSTRALEGMKGSISTRYAGLRRCCATRLLARTRGCSCAGEKAWGPGGRVGVGLARCAGAMRCSPW